MVNGNGEVKQRTISQTAASAIYDNFGAQNRAELKQQARTQLAQALSEGKITEQEMKDALKYLDNKLADALVRRNNVEYNYWNFAVHGNETLEDADADKLMRDCGLNIGDLYEASYLAGADYEVSYNHLNKAEKREAKAGEVTSSELENIRNNLNAVIKSKGGEKELSDKEVKQLMKGLGLSVEPKFTFGNVVKSILGGIVGGAIGLIPGLGKTGTTASESTKTTATQTVGNVTATATSIAAVTVSATAANGSLIGAPIGFAVGAGIGLYRTARRKEKPFGAQNEAAGGAGSVTNKTEYKMNKIGRTAAEAIDSQTTQTETTTMASNETPETTTMLTNETSETEPKYENNAQIFTLPDGKKIIRKDSESDMKYFDENNQMKLIGQITTETIDGKEITKITYNTPDGEHIMTLLDDGETESYMDAQGKPIEEQDFDKKLDDILLK